MGRRAFIYAAGEYTADDIKLYKRIIPKDDDLVICADGGYDSLYFTGIVPHIIIGDFDSVKVNVPKEIPTVKYPSKKDKTDLEICIDYALEQGCDTVFILGALGGRIDHTMGAMCALKYAMEKGVDALILNGKSRIYLVDSEVEIPRDKFDYVSLIPCTETVTGVYTLGLKYELNGRDLVKSSSLGMSNEFYNNTAKIKIESGLLYVVCTQE